MAFEFKRKEPVRKAVRRLGQRQVKKAMQALEHCDRLEAVHEVRKDIKRLRALLRLTRAAIPGSGYRRTSAALRKAAGHLAAARDAHVKVNALADLTHHFRSELSARPFPKIKRILTERCRKEEADLSRKRLPRKVRRLFTEFSKAIRSLRVKDCGWGAIAPGVKRSYRDGRQGYRLAQEAGTPESFHEWRKRAKDLLYQVELLCPIWPEQMAAAGTELKHLTEYLGDDHDLFVLTEASAMKCFRKEAAEEAEAMRALVAQRARQLRAQALSLGGRFYQEKSSVFCKRLGKYWEKWRREPKRAAEPAQ
jgi:CHAD domain-containing protein